MTKPEHPLDHRLIELLVCPLCKGKLVMLRNAEQRPTALACAADRLAYPIRDGIPVMLEGEAQPYEPEAKP
jgi:uncharacterized protein YbaR (Trm112 family)